MAGFGRFSTGADLGSQGGSFGLEAANKITGGGAVDAVGGAAKAGGPGMMLAMKGLSAVWAGFQQGKKNKAIEGAQASLYNIWKEDSAKAEAANQLRDEGIDLQFSTGTEDLQLGAAQDRKSVKGEFKGLAKEQGFASSGTQLVGLNAIEKLMDTFNRNKKRLMETRDLSLKESEFSASEQQRGLNKGLAMQHAKLGAGKKDPLQAGFESFIS